MKHSLLVTGLAFLTLVSLSTPTWGALKKWNQKMQQLGKTFTEILPDVSSSKPLSPAATKKLEEATKKLATLSHSISMSDSKTTLPPEADVTIGFISGMFDRDVKRAYSSLKAGHVDYARSILRTVSGYCIACHTRTDGGPDFPKFDLGAGMKHLTGMERAEYFAATRQFDEALKEFEAIAGDGKLARSRQLEWGRAVRHAFTLAIRVKKDPEMGLAIMNKVGSLPEIPGFYKDNIAAWKKSVQEWKAEPAKQLTTEEELFSEAKRLSDAAKDLQQYPLDHSADVLYLRATVAVHELLTKYPDGKRAADALLMAGTAYDLLEDRLISPLPEMYYEACIRKAPHTPTAGLCYKRYEEDAYFGYTGSAGTSIPDEVQRLLEELKNLASPAAG